MTCVEIFTAAASSRGGDRVDRINAAAPNCGCEAETTSEFSTLPPVDSTETLCRYLTSFDLSEEGAIDATTFDDALRNGLSVDRELGRSHEDLVQAGEIFVRTYRPEAELRAIGRVLVARLREFASEDNPGRCCVYDTALELNQHHAEVMICGAPAGKGAAAKLQRRRFRVQIRDLFAVEAIAAET